MRKILPVIVIAQFCCTSIWFASNGVMNDLLSNFGLGPSALGHLTSGVQLGFITGTLIFAIFTISDRFSPSNVFLTCAFAGAIFNLGVIWENNNLVTLIGWRFMAGFFLAGIYPVGMKIAADHFDRGLGKSLGYLVGALVVGTAFPHLIKGLGTSFPWKYIIFTTSIMAICGGLMIYFLVPDGPFRKASQKVQLSAFLSVFQNKSFRGAAFGYFGHMWELYAFWAFIPVIIHQYEQYHDVFIRANSIWSFLIIAIGGLACVLGGYISELRGTRKTATAFLFSSMMCCFLLPFVFWINEKIIFFAFLLIWGMAVIGDSPLFSTLVAYNSPAEKKGTALTVVNCVGFSITIISIQLLTLIEEKIDSPFIFMILGIGPFLGLLGLRK